MTSWFLVQTKPGREATAEQHLRRQGFETYLPRLAQQVRSRGRWRERIVALFPAYLFLRADTTVQTLGPVRSTRGVISVVRFGQQFAEVPERLISMLRAREDSDTGLHRLAVCAKPKPGAAVTIADGPFDGLQGIFEREVGQDRVIVLINLLGRNTPVRVAAESLLPGLAG